MYSTLKHDELIQCIREYRVNAEFTHEQIIDTLGHPKRVEATTGLLVVVVAALSRPLRFLHLYVPMQAGLSRLGGRI
jgi:hypothetical protein